MASKIELWSMASIMLGNGIQQSDTANNAFINAATAFYDTLKKARLSGHRWGFAQKKQALSKLSETPLNQYQFAYQFPPDALVVYKVYPNSDYQIYGDKIFSNVDSLEVDFLQDVSEGVMPEYFVHALSVELAAKLCYQITKDANLTGELAKQARNEIVNARSLDVLQRPADIVEDQPFIWARNA